ncbi:MAG: O-antigen ligase family protein [Halioglobus sp.]|nr:O-antigen ligase family protein [Halioglobus sp.]
MITTGAQDGAANGALSRTAYALGCLGLYLFCFTGLFWQEGFHAGLILMLLGLLLSIGRQWLTLYRSPAFWTALVCTLYVIGSAFTRTHRLIPELDTVDVWRSAFDLSAIAGLYCIIMAWALQLHARNLQRALVLYLLGYLTALCLGADWGNLAAYLADRPLFGLGSGFGIYTLSTMTGLLIFAYGTAGTAEAGRQQRPARIAALALFTFLLVLFVLGQMRGAWLAALIILPLVAAGLVRMHWRAHPGTPARSGALTLGLALALLLVVVLGYDTIVQRILAEWDVLQTWLEEGASELRISSASYRIWLWQDALEKIRERPLLGWGPGSSPYLIARSDLLQHLSHYHNLYLQIAAEIGLVGLALFAAWLWLVCRGLYRASAEGRVQPAMTLLLSALVMTFALVSLVQYRHSEPGQFYMIYVGGLAVACQLRFRRLDGAARSNG